VFTRLSISGVLLILFLLSGAAIAAEPVKPGSRDRCPVCGMFVQPYPDWLATMSFGDDTHLFFDGPKDLMRYYFSMPDLRRTQISDMYVTDYYTTELKPVAELFFVLGSDVYGPMGKELVPITGLETAQTFQRDHQGRQILKFDQLTPQSLPTD